MVGPEVQAGVPGDIIQVVCEAESAPTPTGVIWTFLGRTIITGEKSDLKAGLLIFQQGVFKSFLNLENCLY